VDLGLSGKVAVVTGGSEGIGRGAAQSLGREGVSVVVCARREDVLQQAAAEVAEATGAQIVPVAADVMRVGDVERVIQTAVDRFGRLDILVNNAGTSAAGAFEHARIYPVQFTAQGQPVPGGSAISFVSQLSAQDFGASAARILPSGVITPP